MQTLPKWLARVQAELSRILNPQRSLVDSGKRILQLLGITLRFCACYVMVRVYFKIRYHPPRERKLLADNRRLYSTVTARSDVGNCRPKGGTGVSADIDTTGTAIPNETNSPCVTVGLVSECHTPTPSECRH